MLTKQIDYFDFWKTKPEVNDILEKLNPNYDFDDLGPAVSNEGFKKRLFVPLERLSLYHFNISVLAVKYYFHEKGLRIHSEKFGWIVLLYNDITDATMINKISGEWVLFKLTKPILFESFENRIIAIEFRGKPFEFLLKKINDKVKPLPLNFLDAVPPLLS